MRLGTGPRRGNGWQTGAWKDRGGYYASDGQKLSSSVVDLEMSFIIY